MRTPLPVLLAAVLWLAALVACAGPPSDAYVGGSPAASGEPVGLGVNAAGEACTQQARGNGADLFCGTWEQPSGHVTVGGPAETAALGPIATGSVWRNAFDSRFNCSPPVPTTILSGAPALLLSCTRRADGWPQIALVASVDGRAYLADGILPLLPVLERSIGVLSGKVSPQAAPALPPGRADALIAGRLAAQSVSAGDIGQYQRLMVAGTRANLAESYVAAERAYRAALALQQKALGRDDPNTAVPLMLVALQLSDQGRFAEADDAFARAARLDAGAPDGTVLPRLQYYRALGAINEDKPAAALPLLQSAAAGYAASLPPELLAVRPAPARASLAAGRLARDGAGMSTEGALLQPDQETALIGVIEARRYQAIVLRQLGRPDEAAAMIRSAAALATGRGLQQRDLTARLYRTAALVDDQAEQGSGSSGMIRADRDFGLAQPGTRPLAQTELLRAAQEHQAGSDTKAVALCRRAAALLRELKVGTSGTLVSPCLSAYAAESQRPSADRQALLAEMFEAAQLVQGGITVQQIAQASARLIEGAKDPRIGAAIRRQQDASLALAELQRRLDTPAGRAPDADATAKQVADAQATLADADAALQAAAPNYAQLVQEVATASDVLAALAPGELFVSLALDSGGGWVFALRDGQISAARTGVGATAMADLVGRVRATIEPTGATPPPFDIAAAQAIYAGTLGPVAAQLAGARALTVVPAGPLLALPFGLLLTGPASQDALATAPWLIRQVAIAHVPAPANFVSLRKAAAGGRATRPWFGLGDFRPVTLAQAQRTFPTGACQDSAALFAGLPPLPFARRELEAARLLLGGSPADELEAGAFTAPRVLATDFSDDRVLHFATHALLPSDLRCQTEPAIVTSAPQGAPNANGALLTSSDVTTMRLDADVVILSACNTGGPNGATSGESLSGLARAFFYAGARSLMVTHWSVNDQATALLVAGTLQRLRAGGSGGIAGSLRDAQLAMLDEAGHGLPAAIAHPFYWAPFALVGEGRGRTVTAAAGP